MNFLPDLGTVIGANVKLRREACGWTQSDLLVKLHYAGSGWSPAALSLLENRGARGERLTDVAELCSVLDTSLWDLFGNDPTDVEMRSGSVRSTLWIARALKGELEHGDH